jgi:ComF family protein
VELIAGPICERCGYPNPQRGPCQQCRNHPYEALDQIRSVAFFDGTLQNALHQLKYRRDIALADTLAQLMQSEFMALTTASTTLVPVPLSARRYRERGYNQAALLARGLADLVSAPYQPNVLRRTRYTVSQVGLTALERRDNVKDAFLASHPVTGRDFMLIDDVCTTGSTLEACAHALKLAGANQVTALTLGRAR